MFDPGSLSSCVLSLFQPENSIIMSKTGDQIWNSIVVHIHDVDESGGPQIKLLMERPVAVARVGRSFEPTFGGDDVRPPVPVHIPRADSVPIALRTDLVLQPWVLSFMARQLIPC